MDQTSASGLYDENDQYNEHIPCVVDVVCSGLKIIYKGCFKSFVALYADKICSDQHCVENRIKKFPSV